MTPGRRLTVTVDARVVFDQPWRGIAKTTVGLYRALAAARPGWRFRLFHREPADVNPFADLPNVSAERIDLRGDRFDLWQRVRLPLANLLAGADVFHAPAGVAPRFPLARTVVIIHDLIPLDTRPTDPDVIAWVRNVRRAAHRARAVLTASEHARARIVAALGVPASKVTVVRWGPASAPAEPPSPERLAEVRKRFRLTDDRPYVLHFGLADPRKNTARVIEAWAKIQPEARGGFALLVVGVEGPARERFAEQARRLGLDGSVLVRRYAPEADVQDLLAGAAALCYPTEYEGFGLPVLDAFAAGVPVLAADATSLPEVAGDAALLVDPADTAAIAEGLTRLLSDPGLRAELAARGRERAKAFDWKQTAETVARVFEAAAGRTAERRPDARGG